MLLCTWFSSWSCYFQYFIYYWLLSFWWIRMCLRVLFGSLLASLGFLNLGICALALETSQWWFFFFWLMFLPQNSLHELLRPQWFLFYLFWIYPRVLLFATHFFRLILILFCCLEVFCTSSWRSLILLSLLVVVWKPLFSHTLNLLTTLFKYHGYKKFLIEF